MQMELQLLSIIRAAKLEHVAYVKLLQFLNSTVSCVSRWCGGIASTRSFPLSDIDMNTHTHTHSLSNNTYVSAHKFYVMFQSSVLNNQN